MGKGLYLPEKWIAIDIECTGKYVHKDDKPFAISTCDYQERTTWTEFRVNPKTRQPIEDDWYRYSVLELGGLLEEYERYVFFHAKFDLTALELIDIDLNDKDFWDCHPVSHVIESSGSHGLKDLALLHFGYLDDDEKELHKACIDAARYARKQGWKINPDSKGNFWLPREVAIHAKYPKSHPWHTICEKYGVGDAIRTALEYVMQIQHPDVTDQYNFFPGTNVVKRELELIPVFKSLETRGVTINKVRCRKSLRRHTKDRKSQTKIVRKLTGIPELNVGSPKQLSKVFHDLELPLFKFNKPDKKTGDPQAATDAQTMDTLRQMIGKPVNKLERKQVDVLTALLNERKAGSATKALTGYYNALIPIAGCDDYATLLSSYNQNGTGTTRTSCSDENVQNAGKGKDTDDDEVDYVVREIYGPRYKRRWLDFDYDQLQLRIFAYASCSKKLITAFENGLDAHDYVAREVYGCDKPDKFQRRGAKAINFGIIFGAGVAKIDRIAGAGSYAKFMRMFPDLESYMQSTIRFVRKHGFVKTLAGYRLTVPRGKPYIGVNYIVQGTEGDIAKQALIYVHNYLEQYETIRRFGVNYLTLFVHDELVIDSPRSVRIPKPLLSEVMRLMEKAGNRLGVVTPVSASIVEDSWDKGVEIRKKLWQPEYVNRWNNVVDIEQLTEELAL